MLGGRELSAPGSATIVGGWLWPMRSHHCLGCSGSERFAAPQGRSAVSMRKPLLATEIATAVGVQAPCMGRHRKQLR